MVNLFFELSKAVDVFNENRIEEEQVEYHEILETVQDRQNEKEVMELIISLYSQSH